MFQLGQAGAVFRLRHRQNRRRVVHVPVHRRLGGVIEESGEFVKLLLREWIKLVIVADRAAGGQSHPDSRRGLGAVAGIEHQILLVDRPSLTRRDVAAVEAAGDPLVENLLWRGLGAVIAHQIAG